MLKKEELYKAFVIKKKDSVFEYNIDKKYFREIPKNDLLIKVNYTNINFKDVMSCKGNPAITRRFPHTPGIDACGTVISSSDLNFKEGDNVLVICQPMGLNSPGAFAEYISIPSSWALRIDEEINPEYIMAIGTAGLTAALAIESLIKSNGKRIPNKIAVTGASGGIGVVSIAILNHLGIKVTALTRNKKHKDKIEFLGVEDVMYLDDLLESSMQNLAKPKWDAAIDVLGGDILSSLIKLIKPGGSISITGNIKSTSFSSNVLPFILRGISLNGINAEMQDPKDRIELVKKMNNDWMPSNLSNIYKLINFDDLPSYMDSFIKGEIFGRLVIKIS